MRLKSIHVYGTQKNLNRKWHTCLHMNGTHFIKVCKKMTKKTKVWELGGKKPTVPSNKRGNMMQGATVARPRIKYSISPNLCTKKGNKTTKISTNHRHQSLCHSWPKEATTTNFSYEMPIEINFSQARAASSQLNAGEILVPLDHPQCSQNPKP